MSKLTPLVIKKAEEFANGEYVRGERGSYAAECGWLASSLECASVYLQNAINDYANGLPHGKDLEKGKDLIDTAAAISSHAAQLRNERIRRDQEKRETAR